MMPDRNRHDDPAPRTSFRRTTLVFIAITIVMAGLTLATPYLVHPTRVAPAEGPTVPARGSPSAR